MFLPAHCSDENLALCWEHCFSILHPSHVVAVVFSITWSLGVGCISFLFLISSELVSFLPDSVLDESQVIELCHLFSYFADIYCLKVVPQYPSHVTVLFLPWFLAVSLCQSCRLSLHSSGFSVPYLLLLSQSGLSPFIAARPHHDPSLYALHDYNVYIPLSEPYFL